VAVTVRVVMERWTEAVRDEILALIAGSPFYE
jgi:hypothetical protein